MYEENSQNAHKKINKQKTSICINRESSTFAVWCLFKYISFRIDMIPRII